MELTVLDGRCPHGARVRITDNRHEGLARANVWSCANPCCLHEGFHAVQEHTGQQPLIVPLPPV